MNNGTSGSSCSVGDTKMKEQAEKKAHVKSNHSVDEELEVVVRGLMNKASPKELNIIHRILCSEPDSSERRIALRTIEEMHRTCR